MEYEPTLKNLYENKELKWVFVGGKGGVGKTTTSSSIGVRMAKERDSVLIISTDPAHNLSDAFDQKFSNTPVLVNGFDNLYCMEVDPAKNTDDNHFLKSIGVESEEGEGFMGDILNSIPGIDEATSFGEVIKQVNDLKFDLIIFDTAPTGHTLRLLNFPNILDKALVKLLQIKEKVGPMLGQLTSMMSGDASGGDKFSQIFDKIDDFKQAIEQVNSQFQDPKKTTFVAVCIPEFLSLYETERLVVELVKFKIDIQNIVVNQVLFVEKGSECKKCHARSKMQSKYLNQIDELYDDFHVVKTPLLDEEVRGIEKLNHFQSLLFEGYTQDE